MGIHHLRNYLFQPQVEIVGVVDRDANLLRQVKEKYGIPGFSDAEQVMALVDAVSIATPTSTHFTIAQQFLRHGKHVLIEKPITSEAHEARELIALARHNRAVLAVGHIERFNPVMQELETIISGRKPLFIDIHRESPYDARIFDTDVVADLTIHDIDLLRYLLQEPIEVKSAYGVRAHSASSDIIVAQMASSSGVLINITTSRATEQKVREWRLIMRDQLIEADLVERKLHITRSTSVAMEAIRGGAAVQYKQEQVIEKVLVPSYEPLQMEIADFLDAIRTGKSPKVDGNEGLHALEVVKHIQALVADKQIQRS
ncbi:Gfo/Idh/MocA family oxidoreductase [Paenibacillus lycopersici]|uniref:Gfo/Idh/MocA family oxidoreductase n=1 Tax=Paenibacillus lycopersici TaxID=2704462 RepID=A0A6C0G667_9BACL|nr:Gfo/Idh/MocA family oxidoreductase [Paenibacillus lycopersici]QHT63429.1 Gfo/Idh/MocA family oxidoreductase [Paenibacillus lycopersici]